MPTRKQRAKALGVSVDQLPDGRGKNPRSWGNTARGPAHHRWNEDRMLSEDGYVKIRVGREHPLADPNGYAYEHLVVWCAAGLPCPAAGELLHHRNEHKADNRLGNLVLIGRGDHNSLHIEARGRQADGTFAPSTDRAFDGVQHDGYPEIPA